MRRDYLRFQYNNWKWPENAVPNKCVDTNLYFVLELHGNADNVSL